MECVFFPPTGKELPSGLLNVNSDGIMGYIKIPKIDVEIVNIIIMIATTKPLKKIISETEISLLTSMLFGSIIYSS